MKKILWTSAMALTAVACLTACDETSSSSFEIPTYQSDTSLPDTCSMEVAKVDTAYFACFENKWIEVTDSATVEQLKEGLDEEEIKAKLEELQNLLVKPSDNTPKSSGNTKAGIVSSDSKGVSSSSEVSIDGNSSSSSKKKSDKENSGTGNGNTTQTGTTTETPESGTSTETPNSAGSGTSTQPSSPSESGSSTEIPNSTGSSNPPESGTSTEPSSSSELLKCGSETYDPNTPRICDGGVLKGVCGKATFDPKKAYCKDGEVKKIALSMTRSQIFVKGDSATTVVSVEDAKNCSFGYNLTYVTKEVIGNCEWAFTTISNKFKDGTESMTVKLNSVTYDDGVEVELSDVAKTMTIFGSHYNRPEVFSFIDTYMTWSAYNANASATEIVNVATDSWTCKRLYENMEGFRNGLADFTDEGDGLYTKKTDDGTAYVLLEETKSGCVANTVLEK